MYDFRSFNDILVLGCAVLLHHHGDDRLLVVSRASPSPVLSAHPQYLVWNLVQDFSEMTTFHFTCTPASLWHHRSAKASASPSLPIYSPLSCTLLNITVSCQLPPCLADFPITPPLYTCPLHNKVGLTASTAPSLLPGPSPNSTMTDAGPHT